MAKSGVTDSAEAAVCGFAVGERAMAPEQSWKTSKVITGNAKQLICDKLVEHNLHIEQSSEDFSEIRDWRWTVAGEP